jgi:hypothetical protein
MTRSAGQWNAYVEAAAGHEDYLRRLEQVPAELRDGVIRHCQVCAAIASTGRERAERRRIKRRKLGLDE